MGYFHELEELLAVIAACDLVITTSNVNAHLAGALGKRTWLLYPADRPPFHYWAHDGSYRCLWYPAVEIASSRELSDWTSLIQHAAAKLERSLTRSRSAVFSFSVAPQENPRQPHSIFIEYSLVPGAAPQRRHKTTHEGKS